MNNGIIAVMQHLFLRCLIVGNHKSRITSYNVCYTKLLRVKVDNKEWGKKELILKAGATAAKGSLKISVVKNGVVDFKFISLFPTKTFKDRPNGMRVDLAEKLAQLKPGFVRFPA